MRAMGAAQAGPIVAEYRHGLWQRGQRRLCRSALRRGGRSISGSTQISAPTRSRGVWTVWSQVATHYTGRTALRPGADLSEISPFHHHEPRDTAIPVLLIGVAGSWMRLIEIRERESVCEKFSHVRCQRTMPVHDANSRPFHPLGKLLEISINAVV